MPAAEKLEAVARIEIFRCMDDLQEASKVRIHTYTYIHTYIHNTPVDGAECVSVCRRWTRPDRRYVCCPDRLLYRRS